MNHETISLIGGVLLDALFICLLAWASSTDILNRIIKNSTILIILGAGITRCVWLATAGYSWWLCPAGFLIGLPFVAFWLKGSLGAGDVKLIIACSLYLGFFGGIIMLAIAFFWLILIMAVFYLRRIDRKKKIPLGPVLTLSAAMTIVLENYLAFRG